MGKSMPRSVRDAADRSVVQICSIQHTARVIPSALEKEDHDRDKTEHTHDIRIEKDFAVHDLFQAMQFLANLLPFRKESRVG